MCETGSACEGATIACPPDYACSASCNGNSACRNLDLATCTSGGDISVTPLAESPCSCAGC